MYVIRISEFFHAYLRDRPTVHRKQCFTVIIVVERRYNDHPNCASMDGRRFSKTILCCDFVIPLIVQSRGHEEHEEDTKDTKTYSKKRHSGDCILLHTLLVYFNSD